MEENFEYYWNVIGMDKDSMKNKCVVGIHENKKKNIDADM